MAIPDIFAPENESPADKAWRLELTTIARLLCLRPIARRGVKIDCALPVYRIEDKETDKTLSYVAFVAVSKPFQPESPAPILAAHAKLAAEMASGKNLPVMILWHWQNQTWGLAKLPEKPQHAPGNDSIYLIPPDAFLSVYEYSREKSTKIFPKTQ